MRANSAPSVILSYLRMGLRKIPTSPGIYFVYIVRSRQMGSGIVAAVTFAFSPARALVRVRILIRVLVRVFVRA